MRRYAQSKVDANQGEIGKALRAAGWSVLSLAPMGKGVPDLIVSKARRTVMLECKDGAKRPSARKLTEAEQAFFDSWSGECYVVTSANHALSVLVSEGEPTLRVITEPVTA